MSLHMERRNVDSRAVYKQNSHLDSDVFAFCKQVKKLQRFSNELERIYGET